MSAILNNLKHIDFSWHPGCIWHENTQKYTYGPIGRRGPGATDEMIEEQKRNHTKKPVPDSLQLYIKLKEVADPELFFSIERALLAASSDILVVNICQMRREKEWKVKDEFVELENEAKAKVDELNKRVRVHIDALEELGVDTSDIEGFKYTVSDEHREIIKEYYNVQSGRFTLCCRKGTTLYDGLAECGILEAVYPKWYANGNY